MPDEENKCPICMQKEGFRYERIPGYLMYDVFCPRCHKYRTSHEFILFNGARDNGHLISGYVREINEQANDLLQKPPEILMKNLEEVLENPLIPKNGDIKTRQKKILNWLRRKSHNFGELVQIDISLDRSIAYAKDDLEFNALLSAMEKKGLITSIKNIGCILTEEGWEASSETGNDQESSGKTEEGAASLRISSKTPATNLKKITKLLEGKKIIGIFDPYLDNKGLDTLSDLKSLGIEFSNTIRLLTGSDQLSTGFIKNWLKEHNPNGEIRKMRNSEHRRFFLLEKNEVLIIGTSLNGLHATNEVIHLEISKEDKEFFELTWNAGTPIGQKVENKNVRTAVRAVEDWVQFKKDQNYEFEQTISERYRDMAEEEGTLMAWLDRKLFKTFPTKKMVIEKERIREKKLREFTRLLEDLNYSKAEIEKMLTND